MTAWERFKAISADVRAVGATLLLLWGGTVFALDSRYLTLTGYEAEIVKQIRREISELEVEKSFAETPQQVKKFETMIQIKENQIKEIKGE